MKSLCQNTGSQRQRREMQEPGPSAQVRETGRDLLALKARNDAGYNMAITVFGQHFVFRAFSAPKIYGLSPRALPWAVTFRAFGAGKPEF